MQPLHPSLYREKLARPPFFQRYGVNLPSSLTEDHSITLGEFSLPTSVGLRYEQRNIWLEAFLGGLGIDDFRPLAGARPMDHNDGNGICLISVLSHGSPSCPFDGFTFPTASPLHSHDVLWCRSIHLLAIAYDVMSSA